MTTAYNPREDWAREDNQMDSYGKHVILLSDADHPAPTVGTIVPAEQESAPDEDMVMVQWSPSYLRWEYTEDLLPTGNRKA